MGRSFRRAAGSGAAPGLSPVRSRCDASPAATMASLPERAAAFLAGDGHRVVQRHLRAHGLPGTYADDLVQETLLRCLTAEARGVEPVVLEAFVSELVRRSARDLLRGL